MEVTLKESEIDFQLIVHPEHTPIEGNALDSGDPQADKNAEEQIKHQLYDLGNELAWCTLELKGTFHHISVSDHLGCCSYESEEQFKKSGYFDSMKQEVKNDIEEKLTAMVYHTLRFLSETKKGELSKTTNH